MDDQAEASTTQKAVVLVALTAVLALGAQQLFGDRGVEVVLLGALAAVAVLAFEELTGRRVRRPWRATETAERTPEPEDTWRSERWVSEAVERGLRALDEWRFEQREA